VRLASLCRRLGLSEVIVVGISIGARSALTLAAFYPELVRRVILMCPTSAPTDVSGDVAQPVLILATRNDGAVSFEHTEALAATLPNEQLGAIDTPTHPLWLGDGWIALLEQSTPSSGPERSVEESSQHSSLG